MGNFLVAAVFGVIVGGISMAIFGEGAGFVIGAIAFIYGLIKVPSLSRKQNEDIARVRQHLDETVKYEMFQANGYLYNHGGVFIDSTFVKRIILDVQENYPNIREEDITIEAIMKSMFAYTLCKNYDVYYFDVHSQSQRPNINLGADGKVLNFDGKKVKVNVIKAQIIGLDVSNAIIEKKSNYDRIVLVADDMIYGQVIPKKGGCDNLYVFREISHMDWGFYEQHNFFSNIIEEIAKEKQLQHA